MSSCGSNCACGSGCSCGSGCNCKSCNGEMASSVGTLISGVAPVKAVFERSVEKSVEGDGCNCGDDCSCDPCSC